MKTRTYFLAVVFAAIILQLMSSFGLPAEGEKPDTGSPLQIIPETLEVGTLSPGGVCQRQYLYEEHPVGRHEMVHQGP